MTAAGRTTAHPKVEPPEKIRPAKIYPISAADIQEYPIRKNLERDIQAPVSCKRPF
jgi:hypothetical protein